MGSEELAANLFRIEMTKARLEREGNIGQVRSESIHRHIGSQVRNMVIESTGKNPEDLPAERRLADVTKQLKLGHKEMKKIDAHKKTTKKVKK